MKKLYELKVTLVIDDDHREEILHQARRWYTQSGGASTVDDDGTEHSIPADVAVQSIDDALMKLIQSHPALDGEAIEITGMCCDSEETSDKPHDHVAEPEDDEDLDDYEAEAQLSRRPNPHFSQRSRQKPFFLA